MKLRLLYLNLWKIAINYVDCAIECFCIEAELPMDIDDPLDQESSRSVSDFGLDLWDVLEVNHVRTFLLYHRLKDLLSVFGDALRVSHVELVTQRHGLLNFLLVCVHPVFHSFLQSFASRISTWRRGNEHSWDTFIILTESTVGWGRIRVSTPWTSRQGRHPLIYQDGMELLAWILHDGDHRVS